MAKSIYVGNLPSACSEDDIRELFAQHGTVLSVKLITDRETGEPRGFGFVEMEGNSYINAIESLNGAEFGGCSLRVNEAREKSARG